MEGVPQQNVSSAGFLLLTAEYPSQSIRQSFLRETDAQLTSVSSLLHKPLPISIPHDDWQHMVKLLMSVATDEFLNKITLRPVRPNDDNYAAFVGPQWNPEGYGKFSTNDHPQLQAFLQRAIEEPTPYFSHCARCTSATLKPVDESSPSTNGPLLRCSRCKMVKYCSKACQKAHWRACHRESCVPAQERSLLHALQTNDAFWIQPDECSTLSDLLAGASTADSKLPKVIRENLRTYFSYAASLGGCFVI